MRKNNATYSPLLVILWELIGRNILRRSLEIGNLGRCILDFPLLK
jgi:hypothetical protein